MRSQLEVSCDDFLVGFIGRFSPCKGVLAMPQIATLISKLAPNSAMRYLIVGSGKEEHELLAALRDCSPPIPLSLCAETSDIRAHLAAIDALVVPSYTEGCPYIILEALAMGTPVIASAVGGVSEIIQHGITGYLFDRYRLEGAAEMLVNLRNDPQSYSAMSVAAVKHAERHFDLRLECARTLELYSRSTGEYGQW